MYQKYIKRIIDVFLALILLIVTFPVMIIITILIKKEDRGNVIFKQERTGKMVKFLCYISLGVWL